MNKSMVLLASLLMLPVIGNSQMTAAAIIGRVDNNQMFKTQAFKATMKIIKGKRTLIKTFYGYGKKEGEQSFMEFTNPEDQGVKYLKLQDELWIYFPDADDVMKISGHMLRQGMMGSDLSYEDLLENDELDENYESALKPDQTIHDRLCFVVELTAKVNNVTYAKQVLYVDQEWFVPLKIEMYARGGRLLKVMTQSQVKKIGQRWVPMEGTIQDKRKRDSKTVFSFQELSFNQPVPDKVFTKGYLQR